jgi:hypothetical protein
MNGSVEAAARLQRGQNRAAIVGGAGLVALVIGAFVSPEQFYRSYLPAYVFVLGLGLGSLALLMVQHLSGGAWGLMIRRILEAGSRTLPLIALLFIPVAFGVRRLFVWAMPAVVASDPVLQAKAPYLNLWFFLTRAVVYFGVWIVFAHLLTRWSAQQDATPLARDDRRFRMLSGPGLLVYGLTISFASVDWMMSLSPHWFSSIYGMLVMVSQALSAMALAIAVLALMSADAPFAGRVKPAHFHDLGKLLFAFVILWAYLAFSQFLLMWSGNLTEEIPWYLDRMAGGWQWLALGIVIGHFFLPFLLLLSRDLKRNRKALMAVAGGILLMRFVDTYWRLVPSYPRGTALAATGIAPAFVPSWMDLAAFVALTGIWLAAFFRYLRSRPQLPVNDPYFEDALAHGGHH